MHTHSLDQWTHEHVYLGKDHARNERRTWLVVALTLAMMAGEIAGGHWFGSMALIADGWHMSTHAAALGIAAFAYRYAKRHRDDPRFTFGTGKFGELAAFTSAIFLAIVAAVIAYECVERIWSPVTIHFGEAIAIAALGLGVNAVSAALLSSHGHHHHHGLEENHKHAHSDHNLRSAYVHVVADAATSLAAIAGLALAWRFDWIWIDPVVGLIGAGVIASWVVRLVRDCGAVLLDAVPDRQLAEIIRSRLEVKDDRVTDLHLWQVGPGHQAAVISIVTDDPKPPSTYKKRLAGLAGLSHVTIEVSNCGGH